MAELTAVTACRPGETLRIVAVKTVQEDILRKLAVFGIVPGAEVLILQTSLAYVLEVGHTQLAIDHSIAKTIYGHKNR